MPAALPVTTPDAEPTEAIPGNVDVQVPPPVASVKVVVDPIQTDRLPRIAEGDGFTVTVTSVIADAIPSDTCILNTSVPLNPGLGV